MNQSFRYTAVIALLYACCAYCATPRVELSYNWKPGEVFRFDYSRTLTVIDTDSDGKTDERKTELSGVLIFEVKSTSTSGTTGTLRMDSPRLVLPPFESFGAQDDEVKAAPERMKAVSHAIEGAIKAARWTAILSPDGALQLESRTPASTAEWLKEAAVAANWRKKSIETLIKIVENDLGLKASALDHDILISSATSTSAAEPPLIPRPIRILTAADPRKDERLAIKFVRDIPNLPVTFKVPNLIAPKEVTGAITEVSTRDGTAIFDSKMGMLDSISESYSGKLKYMWGTTEQMKQEVRVDYKLKRLAPAIRTD